MSIYLNEAQVKIVTGITSGSWCTHLSIDRVMLPDGKAPERKGHDGVILAQRMREVWKSGQGDLVMKLKRSV